MTPPFVNTTHLCNSHKHLYATLMNTCFYNPPIPIAKTHISSWEHAQAERRLLTEYFW